MYSDHDLKQIGPFKAVSIQGNPDLPTIILFHGYGANAHDLVPLHSYLDVPKGTNFLFPDGDLEIPIMPGYTGRAWFPIDMEALQKAMMLGGHRDFSERYPNGLESAREKAAQMIQDLGIPMEKIILGGFSQGAMLATDLMLHSKQKPKGLLILSGTLIHEQEWSRLAKLSPGYKFFQSHGRMDPVLGYPAAKKLEGVLKEAGWDGELLAFPGGHEIPESVLIGMNRYLREILA
ncbi:esterase [Leptospira perolatii]|uniref:Esterase n=1 Tax=Leptospira perolatii TaxID=2023191 RepID=A0A2M9ZM13_9LEPT|nr:esterase [Leptospira perolatii]PJZ69744.1 esterase [Leptospira perolatii]PJZ73041.1 esterase [Leptospira perolatii]